MKTSPQHSERFTKFKLLEFLKKGSNYKPFEGYVKDYDDDSNNLTRSGFVSGIKVEDASLGSKKQIFQPYQQERNHIGKIINGQNLKQHHSDFEMEKQMSNYEQYKKKILNTKLEDSLAQIKSFKIDTASPLTPRNQPIQKKGKLMFDKGLKLKAKVQVQTKKNSILASISQLSSSFLSQNLSQANKRSSLESKQQNSIELIEGCTLMQIPENQFLNINQQKSQKSNKTLQYSNKYLSPIDNVRLKNDDSENQIKKADSKLSKTLDNSLETEENSQQKIKNEYYLAKNISPKAGNKVKQDQVENTSNRSILVSLKRDASQSTLNQSKNTNSDQFYSNQSNEIKNKTSSKNSYREINDQIRKQNSYLKIENQQQEYYEHMKRRLFPQLSVRTGKHIDSKYKEESENNKHLNILDDNTQQSNQNENEKDNRTQYQTNVPFLNNTFDNQDLSGNFYYHNDMAPFESFKKYKYNDPRDRLQKYVTLSEKVKHIQERKLELSNNNNNLTITNEKVHSDRSAYQQIAPPVGTYNRNYHLIEKRIPAFTIKPDHSRSERNLLKKIEEEPKYHNQSLSHFKKAIKNEVEEEGFEKMYSDLIKSIQTEVQEQIQKCGEKYLHPDGDLQLQKHLGLEEISKADQQYKQQAKQLKDKLNKMKVFLAFYQYQV